jgi:hypothetical protein
MKKIKTILRLAGLCTVAVLFTIGLLAGCFSAVDNPLSGAGIPAGKGVVQLNIGGSGGRTAFPTMTGITYTITCTGAEIKTDTSSGNTHTIELAPGTWTIRVEAKNSSSVIIAEGTTEVLVKAGRTTEASVRLAAVSDNTSAGGTLVWSADFPNGLDSAVLAYNTDNVNMLDGSIAVTGTKRSGTLNLDPGVYLISVNLAKGTKKAGDVAAVYIYSGLATTADWTFTADSLVEFKPLALSVDINASSGITVNSAALTLSGNGGMVDQSRSFAKDTGNTWKVTTSIPETASTLSWSLVITTARGPLPEITGTGAAAASIVLPAVNIYTLTATVGENGGLKAGSTDVSNGAVLEFLGGTSVMLTATGDTGYELKTMMVNSATQDSPHTFAINADTTVAVEFDEKTGVDPNLIFEWSAELHGVPVGTTNFAASVNLTGSSSGLITTMPVVTKNGVISWDGTRKGIALNATGTGNANDAIFCIGTSDTTSSTTTSAPDGVFNFNTRGEDGAGVKISMEIAFLTATASRQINFYLSHNLIGNTSPLGASGGGRIVYWADPSTNFAYSANNGGWTAGTLTADDTSAGITKKGTLYTREMKTADGWTSANIGLLAKTFIAVALQNSGSNILIKSIKVEYVAP